MLSEKWILQFKLEFFVMSRLLPMIYKKIVVIDHRILNTIWMFPQKRISYEDGKCHEFTDCHWIFESVEKGLILKTILYPPHILPCWGQRLNSIRVILKIILDLKKAFVAYADKFRSNVAQEDFEMYAVHWNDAFHDIGSCNERKIHVTS
jgi:hypothetical protein